MASSSLAARLHDLTRALSGLDSHRILNILGKSPAAYAQERYTHQTMLNKCYIPLLVSSVILLLCVQSIRAQSYHPNPAPKDSTKLKLLYQKGKKEAREDLNAGILKIKVYKLPMNWDPLYAELALKQYGLRIDFGPDVVMPEEDAYWGGYNGIVMDSLKQKYGSKFLDDTYDKAIQQYKRIRPGTMPLNPEVIRNVLLTNEAKKENVTGLVIVGLDINPKGKAVNIEIIRGLGHGLDERAIETVKKLRFKPAEDQKNAVPVKNYSFPVRFKKE